jgi:DNA-binding CsgD family transcriptional regulator/DNA-binding beta-propeller fold protein YncE
MAKRGRPPYPDVLTPREWEVLSLIRDGLSNDEIASRLGISLDGVKYHVSEILGKLGLENRHDAARWRPEERRPWALAPLSLFRRLDFGSIATLAAGGLLVVVAAGVGLLVWAVVATNSADGDRTLVSAPISTPYDGPIAAYAVVALSSDPMAPLSLKAIDPFTGAAIPDREPIELGHDGTQALSPDGSTIAVGWAAPDSGGSGPQRLSLVDTKRWTKRDTDFADFIQQLFWSPDGSKIYVVTGSCFYCANVPPRLITLDAQTGAIEATANLPFYSFPTFLSPDGRTFYLFGAEVSDPQVVAEPPPPRVVAIDVQTGETRGEVTLAGVLNGARREHDASGDYHPEYPTGDYYAQYFAGVAMSPDGRRMYVAYPDSDRVAVVDLATMRVERAADIEQKSASLFGRLLSVFADKAEAKGGPTNGAAVYFSADGARLYYVRTDQHPPFDANGDPQTTSIGPWVIDPNSLRISKELPAGALDGHGGFFSGVSNRYVFALRGTGIVALDPTDLHQISGGYVGAVSNLVVGPAPPNR